MSEFMTKFHAVAIKYFYNFKSSKVFSAIFSKSDILHLKEFASNKDVVVCKPDKGRAVVIVDRNIYDQKMTQTIEDTEKFQRIEEQQIPP